MKRLALLLGLTTILVIHGTWVVRTQPRPVFQATKVKGDLYMITGQGGNVAAYVTSDGVVLVDDMYDRNHADILSQLRTLTDRPLKYVFNTHQHDDHAGGDAKMLPIAEVIAHKNARANLVAKKQPFFEETPGTPIGLPRVTFSDETSVFREDRTLYAVRYSDEGRVVLQWGTELPRDDDAASAADDDSGKKKDLVVSGGVKGAGEIEGKPAILDIPTGKGRVLAFDFDPIHRYQTLSDFRLVWNAILNWNDLPATPKVH